MLDGKRVRLSGSNKNQVVVEVFVYARVEHAQELGGTVAAAAAAPAARRVARYDPSAEGRCDKGQGCRCGKWHSELRRIESVRPPIVPKRAFKLARNRTSRTLAPMHAAKIDATIAEDDAFLANAQSDNIFNGAAAAPRGRRGH